MKGIAKRYSWSYYKGGLTVEDIEAECYAKLVELDNKNKLKEALGGEGKDKRGRTIYPLLGEEISNYLTDRTTRKLVRDSEDRIKRDALWGYVSTDMGELLKDEPIDKDFYQELESEYANQQEKAKEKIKFGKPFIKLKNRRNLNEEDQAKISGKQKDTPDILLFNYVRGKGIIPNKIERIRLEFEGNKYIVLGYGSFENDLIEKIELEAILNELKKELDDFGKKYLTWLSISMNTFDAQMARELKTYGNKIKRYEEKIIKLIISYKYRDDPEQKKANLKEYEMLLKIPKSKKSIAYWTGRKYKARLIEEPTDKNSPEDRKFKAEWEYIHKCNQTVHWKQKDKKI